MEFNSIDDLNEIKKNNFVLDTTFKKLCKRMNKSQLQKLLLTKHINSEYLQFINDLIKEREKKNVRL